MKNFDKMLEIASNSSIPVLLQGESGVGKEVAARRLHSASARSRGPFIALNCGAIPETLIESTLEGSQKGAFTGASAQQLGIVRAADGGTLFLDEIGEMPLNMQSRLLRILQERSVRPVGATQSIPVDFRLVCATNKNLKDEVLRGTFRQDLFYRLNAFPIMLPPLRKREDFAQIANSIWDEILYEHRVHAVGNTHTPVRAEPHTLSSAEIESLKTMYWPGNIRQLKNVLQRYALLKPHDYTIDTILVEEFVPAVHDPLQPYGIGTCRSTATILENIHKQSTRAHAPDWDIIKEAMTKCGGNKSRAASSLGISRGCLCYQIKRHDFS